MNNKTSKYKRFPITKSFKTELEEFITKRDEEWLFASQRGGKPISRIQAYRIICNACVNAGITARIGTHTLRKTFGYHFTKRIRMLHCCNAFLTIQHQVLHCDILALIKILLTLG